MNSPNLAIIIPTMNRSEFIVRQLAYMAAQNCRFPIYLGDSSAGEHWDRTAQAVARFEGRIKVHHLEMVGLNDTDAIMAALRAADEPYAVFNGDDDFLVPDALEQCVRFLDGNPNYAMAHGIQSGLRLDKPGQYGAVAYAHTYDGLRTLERATAAERLLDFMNQPFSTNFSIQRTETFLGTMESTPAMADRVFRELLPNSLRIVGGPAKRLDCLYLIRQDHETENRFVMGLFDWITGADWNPSYQMYCQILTDRLAAEDGIGTEDAGAVVKRGFESYLSRRLQQQLAGANRKPSSGIVPRTRQVVKNIPVARTAYRRLRAMRSAAPRQYLLEDLMRRSSPYHANFMPVVQALSAPAKEAQSKDRQGVS